MNILKIIKGIAIPICEIISGGVVNAAKTKCLIESIFYFFKNKYQNSNLVKI